MHITAVSLGRGIHMIDLVDLFLPSANDTKIFAMQNRDYWQKLFSEQKKLHTKIWLWIS